MHRPLFWLARFLSGFAKTVILGQARTRSVVGHHPYSGLVVPGSGWWGAGYWGTGTGWCRVLWHRVRVLLCPCSGSCCVPAVGPAVSLYRCWPWLCPCTGVGLGCVPGSGPGSGLGCVPGSGPGSVLGCVPGPVMASLARLWPS